VYAKGGPEGGVERFAVDEVDLSASSANAAFGKNRIKVLEGGCLRNKRKRGIGFVEFAV
jgi:hypothetical protein